MKDAFAGWSTIRLWISFAGALAVLIAGTALSQDQPSPRLRSRPLVTCTDPQAQTYIPRAAACTHPDRHSGA